MFIKLLKGKIHRATVTKTKLHYPGSIGIDADILRAANIKPYEHVLVANVTNGSRVDTYAVEEPPGSRDIVILGAAAKLFETGDIIIIMNFGYYTSQEASGHKPSVVVCDESNNITPLES